MKRVLYYGSTAQVHSGASQWMFRLARGMEARDWHTVSVLPDRDGIAEWYEESGLDVEYLRYEPLRRRRSISGHVLYLVLTVVTTVRLAAIVRRRKVDVVHINDIRYLPGLLAARLGGARTVCHVRACFESETVRLVLSRLVTVLSHEVVCVSDRTRDVMFEEVEADTSSVTVVHDAVPSPERFESLPEGRSFREQYGIDESAVLVLQVSKLTRNKGQDRVVAAADCLDDHPNIEFAIVGGSVDGHEKYARAVADRASGLESVHLTGFHPDVTTALAAADVLIHVPRHEDPFPGVVMEGMLAGLPVVGSRSGGIPEQVDDGETGVLVAPDASPATIAAAIESLANDVDYRLALGRTAANRVRERFPVEPYFDTIETYYRPVESENESAEL